MSMASVMASVMASGWAAALVVLCAVATGLLVRAEHRRPAGSPLARAGFKLTASTAFVGLAWALGAMDSDYGRWVLAALVLGWLGDALLLSDRAAAFMGGLAAFLVSHAAYVGAFISARFDWQAFGMALVPLAVLGWGINRWLRPHLDRGFETPVTAYVVVILAMVAAAVGRWSATGWVLPLVGAVLFAASDIAVARERFVAPGFINRAWGLPTYFAAQLMLAASVAAALPRPS